MKKKKFVALTLVFLLLFGFYTPTKVNAASMYGTITQIDATDTTATISWPAVPDAVSYALVDGTDTSNPQIIAQDVTTTTYTVNVDNGSYRAIYVYPCYAGTGINSSEGGYVIAYAAPKKVNGIKYYYTPDNKPGFNKTKGLEVIWNTQSTADGYEAVLKNKSGKKIQTKTVQGTNKVYFSKATTSNCYTVQVRSFKTIGGQKLFGSWSDKFYAVPQPRNTSKKSGIKKHSITIKWNKVKGASSYSIYVSKSSGSAGKKVATVKGSKSSYTLTKYKGKGINTLNNYYYVTIVTNTKMGGKVRKSKKYYYTSYHSYYTY